MNLQEVNQFLKQWDQSAQRWHDGRIGFYKFYVLPNGYKTPLFVNVFSSIEELLERRNIPIEEEFFSRTGS